MRWFLGGSSVSMLGSRLTSIAYPMLVLRLHGTPLMTGLAVCAASAPSLLCYLPVGAFLDTWDARKTMLAAEVGRGLVIGGVVFLLVAHRPSVTLVILLAVIEETLEVFAVLADRRIVRDLVDYKQAGPALASFEARTHAIVLSGRALGGALFEILPVLPFLFDAVSFVASIASLWMVGRVLPATHPLRRKRGRSKKRYRRRISLEMRDGASTLFRDPYARDASLVAAGMTFVSQALILVFLVEAGSMRLSAFAIGCVLAASGFGGLLGSAAGKRLFRLQPRTYGPAKLQPVIWSAMLAVLAITSLTPSSGLACMAVAMTAFGFVGSLANMELDTYLTRTVQPEKLLRVTGINMQLSFAAGAIGPVLGGGFGQLAKGTTYGAGYAAWGLCAISALFLWFAFRKPEALVPKEYQYFSRKSRFHYAQWVSQVPAGFSPRRASGNDRVREDARQVSGNLQAGHELIHAVEAAPGHVVVRSRRRRQGAEDLAHR